MYPRIWDEVLAKKPALQRNDRATYHQVYICQDAADMSGTVVHTRGIIDNGQPGGTCQNTHSVGKKLLDDTVLRVFIACAYKVEPCLKKKAAPS